MLSLFVLLAVVGLPAFTLRVMCVGHSCDEPRAASVNVPFCSLPDEARALVGAGFRDGRSPEVLGVASGVGLAGGEAYLKKGERPAWPSVPAPSIRVPIVFHGPDIGANSEDPVPPEGALPAGTGLDDIAPTLAELMGIERPHPEVRSGRPIPEASSAGGTFPFALQIVWKGVGSEELEARPQAWPNLRTRVEQIGTMDGSAASLPLDPAAVLTTIGTGGTPSQHGVTGSLIRDEGRLVEAWSADAPVSVIAALGDDMDEVTGQRAEIGLVAADPIDRGLIGRDWYVDSDKDEVVIAPRPQEAVAAVRGLFQRGFGDGVEPVLLAVTLDGTIEEMDAATGRIIGTMGKAVGAEQLVIVIAATGSSAPKATPDASDLVDHVESKLGSEVVEAAAPGGLFLDQDVLADENIGEDEILDMMRSHVDPSGNATFADVFPAIAVSFGRYC